MNILGVSTEYFNPAEPQKGIFVKARMEAIARLAHVSVLSPIAVFDYAGSGPRWHGARGIPKQLDVGGITVEYPRWLYPPRGGVLNAFFLFARLLRPALRLTRTYQFDVIVADFGHPEGIAVALLASLLKVPFVITIRGCELYHRQYRFRRSAMAWAIRRASRVLTVSDELRRLALSFGARPDRVLTILNGINADVFFPQDSEECRRLHGIPQDAPVILSVGYLAEIKGHHRIIQALHGIRQQGVPAVLIIAGGDGRSGKYGDEIRKQINDRGLQDAVRFTGDISQAELAQLMSASTLLCLASSREGCPNVVNEALACGTPVVASDVGAVRRMIPSAEYGAIVPPNDVAALQHALRLGLETGWDRHRIARWGQSRSWKHVALEVLGEIEQAVSENASSCAPR